MVNDFMSVINLSNEIRLNTMFEYEIYVPIPVLCGTDCLK